MAKKKADKQDDLIAEAWYRLAFGVQVDIMDIPKIFRDVKLELAAGTQLDEAIKQAIQKYEVKA